MKAVEFGTERYPGHDSRDYEHIGQPHQKENSLCVDKVAQKRLNDPETLWTPIYQHFDISNDRQDKIQARTKHDKVEKVHLVLELYELICSLELLLLLCQCLHVVYLANLLDQDQ